MSIEPLHPASHLDAVQRLNRRLSTGEAGAVAADPYAQMRANPLQGRESVQPGDPTASVRSDVASVEPGQRARVYKPDAHVKQPSFTERGENPGQATVEQFENHVDRKRKLESAMDIRQASSGRLGALSQAEQRPDAAAVNVAMMAYRPADPSGPIRKVEAVTAGHSNRPYGQEAVASRYRRVSRGADSSSILEGAPNLEPGDDFDAVAGVAIPRVGILK